MLPVALRQGLARLLDRIPAKALALASQALSDAYRRGDASDVAVDSEAAAAAYLATRMPATYAAMSAALASLGEHAPGFAPLTLLDAGAGPGTASWAAAAQFPSLQGIVMLDSNAPLLAMARALREDSPSDVLRDAAIISGDVTSLAAVQLYDLVLAGYATTEIPSAAVADTLDRLWRACKGIFVIVEPGTPKGFARLRECRTHLLQRDARILAPCPGDHPCFSVWCHFSVRLPRLRAHKLAKHADVPFEDEKFSYLAVARPEIAYAPAKARIVSRPRATKAGIVFRLCRDGAISEQHVPKRDRPLYKSVARRTWGDEFPDLPA